MYCPTTPAQASDNSSLPFCSICKRYGHTAQQHKDLPSIYGTTNKKCKKKVITEKDIEQALKLIEEADKEDLKEYIKKTVDK